MVFDAPTATKTDDTGPTTIKSSKERKFLEKRMLEEAVTDSKWVTDSKVGLYWQNNVTRIETKVEMVMTFWDCDYDMVRWERKRLANAKHYADEKNRWKARGKKILSVSVTNVLDVAVNSKEKLDRVKKMIIQGRHPRTCERLSDISLDDETHPENGAEAVICSKCEAREYIRDHRGKKKVNCNKEFDDNAKRRSIRIIPASNCHEYADMLGRPGTAQHKMVNFAVRITCHCRHQDTQDRRQGFRIIFTFRDEAGTVVDQRVTDRIMVLDSTTDSEKDKTSRIRKMKAAGVSVKRTTISPETSPRQNRGRSSRTGSVVAVPQAPLPSSFDQFNPHQSILDLQTQVSSLQPVHDQWLGIPQISMPLEVSSNIAPCPMPMPIMPTPLSPEAMISTSQDMSPIYQSQPMSLPYDTMPLQMAQHTSPITAISAPVQPHHQPLFINTSPPQPETQWTFSAPTTPTTTPFQPFTDAIIMPHTISDWDDTEASMMPGLGPFAMSAPPSPSRHFHGSYRSVPFPKRLTMAG